MDRRELGDTGLEVTRLGLGAGGGSRLGLARGKSPQDASEVLLAALDSGLNYVDTAADYGTEAVVGRALRTRPDDSVVVSTKFRHRTPEGALLETAALRASVESSLHTLDREHLDVLFLHGVRPAEYDYCNAVLLPELDDLRRRGLVRAIGVTESFANDPAHEMARQALADGHWDVLMLGYNLLNPSAHELIRQARSSGTGLVGMYAVRWLLTDPVRLLDGLRSARDSRDHEVDRPRIERSLQKLAAIDLSGLLPAAAYYFSRSHPDIDSVLIGTGDPVHLRENIEGIERVAADERLPGLLDALRGVLNATRAGSGDDSRRHRTTSRPGGCVRSGG